MIAPMILDKNKMMEELKRIRSGNVNTDNQVYYVLASGEVVIVKEGEKGHYPTDWVWDCLWDEAMEMAAQRNLSMGVSRETAEAIVIFSMA